MKRYIKKWHILLIIIDSTCDISIRAHAPTHPEKSVPKYH